MKRSRLSDIPGLGPKRVKELLAHFRSIDAIQLASAERIAEAPGVGPALAQQIWAYFHPDADADTPDINTDTAPAADPDPRLTDSTPDCGSQKNGTPLELAG